jgi:hypothetical protein
LISSVSINVVKTNNAPHYVERFKVSTVLMVMFNSPPFSILNAKHFEIVYALHHLYIMYSNVETPSDVTYLPAGSLFITLHYTDNVIYTCQEVTFY